MSNHSTFPIGINVFAVRDGKLLLGKRKGAAGADTWGLPGGHLENGENMFDAAARELKEETSLKADKFTFVNLINDNANNNRHYIQVGFLAEGFQGEVKLMEPESCLEWRWFPLADLPGEIFFGHAKQIELFFKKLPFGDSA